MTIILALAVLAAQPPRLEPAAYPSRIFGGDRRVWVYTPRAPAKPAGLLVCLWGGDYVDKIDAPATLDALIGAGRIPPLNAVFLDDSDDRFQSFQTSDRVARSIVEELIPWARARHIDADPDHTIVAGYSAAGLGATYAAFAHPDVFGRVLAQSGAYWRGFEGPGGERLEWLAAQYESAPRRATRFSLEVGGAEERPAGGTSVSIKAANEHLRDVLLKKGYTLSYREVPGAQHEYGHWKAAFGPALIALMEDAPAHR